MIKNHLLVAWRHIQRHKGYAAIHVFGLGVGICACMSIWAITHYELSFDKFHPGGDRIYRLVAQGRQFNGDTALMGELPEPAVAAIRKGLTGAEAVAQFHDIDPMIEIPGTPKKRFAPVEGDGMWGNVMFAEPQYFDIFTYQWLAGNAASLEEPYHVVLTAKEAERFFGTRNWENILGRQVIYDDSIRTTVTGIVQDFDRATDLTFSNFISYSTTRAAGLTKHLQLDNWGSSNGATQTFVKLESGVSTARIEAELKGIMSPHLADIAGQDKPFYRVLLQPLTDIHYNSLYAKDYGTVADMKTLYRLMGVAFFILILASINFINLSTAQSLRRAKEIGIRKVLGSRRIGLILQFMTETLVLALVALLLSLALLKPLLNFFTDLIPAGVAVNFLNPETIAFAGLVVLAAAISSGLYPAVLLSSFKPAQTLKGQTRSPRNWGNRLGKALVVFQFTISAIFIIAAIVVGDQMHYMLHRDMGFDRAAVIRMDVQENASNATRRLLAERLRAIPGVDRVSMDICSPILDGSWTTNMVYPPGKFSGKVELRAADTNYLSVYGLKLLAGRNYFYSDTLREIVINEMFARQMGFRRPQAAVGHSITLLGKKTMIVGVVANFNTRSLQYSSNTPLVIAPLTDYESGYSVKLHTQGVPAAALQRTIAAIGKNWGGIFPNETFHYQWMDEYVAALYKSETQTASLVNIAMIVTIVVSGMGLFGLAALTAGQRIREIGIRKVLGAGLVDITAMVSREFVLLVVIALLIASPVAWWFLHDWLNNYQSRVGIGWWVFGLAGLFAIGVTLLTVGFHAVRAGLVNPVKSLRNE